MVHTGTHVSSFLPSQRLINMFAEGARSCLERAKASEAKEAHYQELPSTLELDDSFISGVIDLRIRDVLVSLGGRRQAIGVTYEVIAKDAFPADIEEEILEMLPIDEDHGHEFCQALLSEVKDYLKGGGMIAGGWGVVQLTDAGELAVKVTKQLRKRVKPARSRRGIHTVNF